MYTMVISHIVHATETKLDGISEFPNPASNEERMRLEILKKLQNPDKMSSSELADNLKKLINLIYDDLTHMDISTPEGKLHHDTAQKCSEVVKSLSDMIKEIPDKSLNNELKQKVCNFAIDYYFFTKDPIKSKKIDTLMSEATSLILEFTQIMISSIN